MKNSKKHRAQALEAWKATMQQDLDRMNWLWKNCDFAEDKTGHAEWIRLTEALEHCRVWLMSRFNLNIYYSCGTKVCFDEKIEMSDVEAI